MSDEITSKAGEKVLDALCTEPLQNHVIEGSLKVNDVPYEDFLRSLELTSDNHGENYGGK